MRFLFYIIAYALSLAPVAALANYMSSTASLVITGGFEQIMTALHAVNASLIVR